MDTWHNIVCNISGNVQQSVDNQQLLINRWFGVLIVTFFLIYQVNTLLVLANKVTSKQTYTLFLLNLTLSENNWTSLYPKQYRNYALNYGAFLYLTYWSQMNTHGVIVD